MEEDAKKTKDFRLYNILPLEKTLGSNPFQHFPEVRINFLTINSSKPNQIVSNDPAFYLTDPLQPALQLLFMFYILFFPHNTSSCQLGSLPVNCIISNCIGRFVLPCMEMKAIVESWISCFRVTAHFRAPFIFKFP